MAMYQHQMYVRPEPLGDDANDGLSWDTAKRTIMAAYDDIPGGDIFIGSESSRVGAPIGVQAQTDPGAGIWITEDPEVVSRDPRWRKPKPVRFIGAGPSRSQFGHPAAFIDVKNTVPSIWLWDTAESNYFQDLIVNRPIWIGIAPDEYGKIGHEYGNRWGNVQSRVDYEALPDGSVYKHIRGAASLARFIRVHEIHEVHPHEPVIEADANLFEPSLVIGNAFWLWFTQCRFIANAGATNDMYSALATALPGQFRAGDDERAVILIRPDSRTTTLSDSRPPVPHDLVHGRENEPSSNSGLLFLEDLITGGGHVVFYDSPNGGSLSMRDAIFESEFDFGSPVLVRGKITDDAFAKETHVELRNCKGADNPSGWLVPDVWIQARASASQIIVEGSNRVRGPCIALGNLFYAERGTTPEAVGQAGFWAGNRIAGMHDAARRIFSMAALPVKNLLNPPRSWHSGLLIPGEYSHYETVTILTTGIKGPDGAQRAFRVLRDSGTEEVSAYVFLRSETLKIGMRMIVAGWLRPSTYETSPPHISFHFNPTEPAEHPLVWRETGTNYGHIFGVDNRWTFAIFAATLEGDRDVVYNKDLILQLAAPYRRAAPHDREVPYCDFCDLFYTKIEPGAMTDQEFAELAHHMVSIPGNVEPGTLTTHRNQDALFQGRVTHQSHVAYGGAPATCRARTAAGVGASSTIKGNDVCGVVKLLTGDAPRAGEVAQVSFQTSFFSDPVVSVSPANKQAAAASVYATANVSGLSIFAALPLLRRQEYVWNYYVPGLDKP